MRKVFLMALCALAMVGCNRGYKFEVVANIGYPDVMYYLSPEAQPSTYYMSAKSDAEGVVRFEGKSDVPMAVCLSDGLVNLHVKIQFCFLHALSSFQFKICTWIIPICF